MVWIVNKSQRAYNIGGVLVTPLIPVQIDDDFLNNERVKEIMADGDIERTEAPTESANETNTASSDNKPATKLPDESREQHDSSKSTHDNLPPLPSNRAKPAS